MLELKIVEAVFSISSKCINYLYRGRRKLEVKIRFEKLTGRGSAIIVSIKNQDNQIFSIKRVVAVTKSGDEYEYPLNVINVKLERGDVKDFWFPLHDIGVSNVNPPDLIWIVVWDRMGKSKKYNIPPKVKAQVKKTWAKWKKTEE